MNIDSAIDLYRQDPSTSEALNVAGELMRSIERVAASWPTESERLLRMMSSALPSTDLS
jgi:hypothetical protein